MTHKNVFFILIIISFLIVSCNTSSLKQTTIDSIVNDSDHPLTENDDTKNGAVPIPFDDDDYTPMNDDNTSMDFESQPEEVPQNKPTKAKTQTPSMGGKETLYISTYGANGKVWGHVTMNGNKGRGTIHDDDENSYSITVTRHGGELFGIDQNGREYVFRL